MEDEDLFHKVIEIRKLAAKAPAVKTPAVKAPAAAKQGVLGKMLGKGKGAAMLGGGLPLLAMLLAGPSILKAVGHGVGRAAGREGRGPWSPEAQIQGPPAPMGMNYGHQGFAPPFQM